MNRYELECMIRHVDGNVFFEDTISSDNLDELQELASDYYDRYKEHPLYSYVQVTIWDSELNQDIPIYVLDNK